MARYCKKCKLVFETDVCPGGHAIFMYTKTIPEGAERAAAEPAAEPEQPKPGKKPRTPTAPPGLGAMLGGGGGGGGGGP